MTPFFSISANGTPITDRLSGFGVRLSVIDGVGTTGDRIELEITDPNGLVDEPDQGMILDVSGGYLERPLRRFGAFKVDQVSVNGYPQTISVFGQSVDARSVQKERRTRAYPQQTYPTYGDIFAKVADEIGLSLKIDPELAARANTFEAQTEESGLAFARRIGESLDAGVTAKDGNLVIVRQGEGTTASGRNLPVIDVSPGHNLIGYSVSLSGKPQYGRVKATWFDQRQVEHKMVVATAGGEGPEFVLRAPYQNEEDAARAADAKVKELSRAQGSASFELVGDPNLPAESFLQVTGVKRSANGLWRSVEVTHTFSSSAPYTNTVRCESPTGGPRASSTSGSSANSEDSLLVGSGLLGDGAD